MNNLKEYKNVKKTIFSNLPFVVLFISFALLLNINFFRFSDDIKFFKVPVNIELGNYLIERYQTWSSRLLIDFLTVILVKVPKQCIIFILSLVYTLISYNISNLTNYDRKIVKNIVICSLMLFFPFWIERSAGIISTNVNYVFPVLFSLICLNYFIKLEKNDIKNKRFFIYILPFLIATDSEQITLVAFIGFITYFIYCKYSKKSPSRYLLMYFCLLIAKIFFIVLCPGNKLRYGKEIIDWYKEYNNFNFIYKIYIGITYSTGVLFANPYIIVLFSISIFILTLFKSKKKLFFLIALISFVLNLLLSLNCFNIGDYFWTKEPNYNFIIIIPILLFIVNFLLLVINFEKNWLIFVSIYVLGFLSHLLIAFSPTIYASSFRTGTILYFSFIILNYFCILKIFNILEDSSLISTRGE